MNYQSLADMKAAYRPRDVARASEAELEWFRAAKFGMFIHWGLYSLLGRGEWAMFDERLDARRYGTLVDDFRGESFDPDAWAAAAKAAGMKYMVLTSRHHDGFALFDTAAGPYNSVAGAARRDMVAGYAEACRKAGLKVGLYYSPMDWRFPGYFFPEMYHDSALAMRDQCRRQVRELMTNYGKIDLLWFDGEWLAHGGIKFEGERGWYRRPDFLEDELYFKANYFWQSEETIEEIRRLQPGILINNRFCWPGDFVVRERVIGEMKTDVPWESCDCLADSWGWIPDRPVMDLRRIVADLIATVVRDGNYLLNVGPMGSGMMEGRQVQRLAEVGAWLAEFGESVYGTRGGPIPPAAWGGATHRGDKVYLHVVDWPQGPLTIESPPFEIVSCRLLSPGRVDLRQRGSSVEISVAERDRHPLDTIIELEAPSNFAWNGRTTAEA